jgi:hypothetical protein
MPIATASSDERASERPSTLKWDAERDSTHDDPCSFSFLRWTSLKNIFGFDSAAPLVLGWLDQARSAGRNGQRTEKARPGQII